MKRILRLSTVCLALLVSTAAAFGQAFDIPSASPASANQGPDTGRKLIDQMVQALGGEAWLNRRDWTIEGRGATFYKGVANPYVIQYEEFHRADPFAVRIEFISKMGIFIPTSKRDIVQVWTPENGFEVTYRGKKELPKDDVTDYQRRRAHSLEALVNVWMKKPGVEVVYEGTSAVGRRPADKLSVLSADNDAITLELDVTTHLPLSRTFRYRNELYKDRDEDREEYNDYHDMGGLPTALTITRFRNGDMVSQRFYTKITYNTGLSPVLFDPDKALVKKK